MCTHTHTYVHRHTCAHIHMCTDIHEYVHTCTKNCQRVTAISVE